MNEIDTLNRKLDELKHDLGRLHRKEDGKEAFKEMVAPLPVEADGNVERPRHGGQAASNAQRPTEIDEIGSA